MKEITLNYEEIKEIRKAIATQINVIDCIEEEERFEKLSSVYDLMVELEEEIEKEQEQE